MGIMLQAVIDDLHAKKENLTALSGYLMQLGQWIASGRKRTLRDYSF
jgi:hypothetical protein